jgi:hypothetical protein
MNVQRFRKKPVTVEAMHWDGTPEGRAADRIEELEGGGKPPVRKAIGHEESTYEFVADGNIYRVLRIDPVYGTIVEPSGEDGQAK